MKAFPASSKYDDKYNGMDLRDYFAAHIMQGLVANNLTCDDDEQVIKSAWGLADKMMEARNASI